MSTIIAIPVSSEIFRHKKSGELYEKLFEADNKSYKDQAMVVYRKYGFPKPYVRTKADFNMAFEPISNP